MVAYGIACVAVLALALVMERRAVPFALIVLSAWVLGFLGWWSWAVISLSSGLLFFWLFTKDRHWRWAAVSAIEGGALILDVLYLWFRWRGIPIEVEYANALTFGLICKLAIIGSGGLWNGIVLLRSWSPSNLRSRRRVAFWRMGLGKKAATG